MSNEIAKDLHKQQFEESQLHRDEDYFKSEFITSELIEELKSLKLACTKYGWDFKEIIGELL
jgi:hypothetical protein